MKEQKVTFKSKGQRIVGILHLPDKPTKSCVIISHGFTANKSGPMNSFVKLSEELVKCGIATLRFNFRFTTEDLSEFQNMTISGEVRDLKTIINKMSKKYDKIGVVGESMGGAVSMLSYNKKINCLVLWYPVTFIKKTDLNRWLSSKEITEELRSKGYVTGYIKSRKQYFKVGKDFVKERQKINLIPYAKKISCPTLIIHGDKDISVNSDQSERLSQILKTKNKKLELVKNMGHAFWNKAGTHKVKRFQKTTIKLTTDWFDKWLNPLKRKKDRKVFNETD